MSRRGKGQEGQDPIGVLVDHLSRLHPDEVAAQLESTETPEGADVLRGLEPSNAAKVLARTSGQRAVDLFLQLKNERIALLEAMEPARAATMMGRLSEEDRAEIIEALPPAKGKELRELMDYPPGSAGRLMDPMVTTLRPTATVDEALEQVRGLFPRRIFDVWLVDSDGRLVGGVALQEIATAKPGTPLSEIANPTPPRVADIAGRDEIAEILENQRLSSLPVVDFDQRVVGVIRYGALMDAIERDAVSSMQSMVGASPDERALSKVSFAVKKRLPWLQVNLATAFIAAGVVGLFEDTIQQFTALAVLLPVVAGQSGNTGAQALIVIMRGLSLREITPRQWLKVVTKEGTVGMINGLAVAVVTSVAVYFWSRSPGLAAIIGVSMVVSMALAAMAGASIPLLLKMIGQDPAQSSSIVLTTVTDVTGFLSFLGLATLFSSVL